MQLQPPAEIPRIWTTLSVSQSLTNAAKEHSLGTVLNRIVLEKEKERAPFRLSWTKVFFSTSTLFLLFQPEIFHTLAHGVCNQFLAKHNPRVVLRKNEDVHWLQHCFGAAASNGSTI